MKSRNWTNSGSEILRSFRKEIVLEKSEVMG